VTLEDLCENVEHLEKYDAIIASEVIEHINDVDSFIGNIAKLLKVRKISIFLVEPLGSTCFSLNYHPKLHSEYF